MWGALVAAVLAVIAYFAWILTVEEGDWGYVTGIAFWVFLLAVPGWPLGRWLLRRWKERPRRG